MPFIVNYGIPQGFAIVEKYEWFVNGVSVKTTTDPSDFGLNWQMLSNPTSVYCKVTYKKQDGTLSSPFTSTTFTPIIKQLNFGNITTSTPPPNYGCSNTASYSLNTFPCTQLCDYVYTVGQYNISWQPPAGWVQTNISTNGNDVSFAPDATTGGTLTATITLPCGFTETKTFTVSRSAPAPTFSSSNPSATCASTATFSINPTCGATNYTYTITGSTGITFTANGLQTLTTASSSADISFSGAASVNTLKARANYPGSNSSTDASSEFTYGAAKPNNIDVILVDPSIGRIQVAVDPPVPGATSYNWYKNNVLQNFYHQEFAQITITRNVCDVWYDIAVEAVNTCGVSAKTHKNVYVPPCGNFFQVSPNPASSSITVSADESKVESKTFDEVRIYNFQGMLMKYQKLNSAKTTTLNVTDLINGNYFIEIKSGTYKEKQQLIIQK
ncbi:MAG TPA: T9SS type A sorting domain-containing protein [Chitinophagaceae bacterium]|nr:T9SS type A sorting domain-containing protein [Chitinophagaceae bacterium]